jgi:hypothetical protein
MVIALSLSLSLLSGIYKKLYLKNIFSFTFCIFKHHRLNYDLLKEYNNVYSFKRFYFLPENFICAFCVFLRNTIIIIYNYGINPIALIYSLKNKFILMGRKILTKSATLFFYFCFLTFHFSNCFAAYDRDFPKIPMIMR